MINPVLGESSALSGNHNTIRQMVFALCADKAGKSVRRHDSLGTNTVYTGTQYNYWLRWWWLKWRSHIVLFKISYFSLQYNGIFKLLDTNTEGDTDIDTFTYNQLEICVDVCLCAFENLHRILYNPFFIGFFNVLGVGQCEHTMAEETRFEN